MTIKISEALANDLLDGASLKSQLDGGFISIYAGAEPATADAALDTSGVHTRVCKIGSTNPIVGDEAAAGLTFAASASARAIVKLGSEVWQGRIHFAGFVTTPGTLTGTFFRFHKAADTVGVLGGSAAGSASTPRIQGSVGSSGADMVFTSASFTDNGSDSKGLSTFEVRIP